MTEEETASAASTLAFATRQWLLGDFVGAPSAMRAALQLQGVQRARPLMRETRRRSYYHDDLGKPSDVVRAAVEPTAPELRDWCLLGAVSHRSGYLRQAVAQHLLARSSMPAAAAAMLLADDHVAEIRSLGQGLTAALPPSLLGLFPHILAERWQSRARTRWRLDALERLRCAEGLAALRDCALTSPEDIALAAIVLIRRLHELEPVLAAELQRSSSWRVRAEITRAAVQQGWQAGIEAALDDPERLVRRAAGDTATRRKDGTRAQVMRHVFKDDAADIRRIASWYVSDDEALRTWCEAELREGGPRRVRLAPVNAIEVCPERARQVAERLLTSSSAADRCAAVRALVATTGLQEHHVRALASERSDRVRRVVLSALERAHDLASRQTLAQGWSQ